MSTRTIDLKILDSRIGNHFPLPDYATIGAAGLDLRAILTTSQQVVRPGESHLIPTGIAIHLRDKSLAALVIPRSGLGHRRGIIMGNGVGLIDSDYTGTIFVSCWNRSDTTYTILLGERIAQLVIVPIVRAEFRVVQEFGASKRGAAGFGSTGTT